MDELIAFARARLDEDESAARATMRPTGPSWPEVASAHRIPDAAHIARHDPARVLREVEADRKLLAELEHAATADFGITGEPYDAGWYGALELAVRIRAERFSGHPDYPSSGGSHAL